MAASVRVKEALVITPSEPTPARVLSLSALDSQLFLRFTVEYLLVYRAWHGLDQASTTARLKLALAEALVPYYPFAGRIRPRPDSPGLEVFQRLRETAENRFSVEKTVVPPRGRRSKRIAAAGRSAYVAPRRCSGDRRRDHHCISDGIGSAEFLNYFAELASRKRVAGSIPKPVWDRHLLNPPPPAAKKIARVNPASHPEFNRVPDLCDFMKLVSTGLKPTSITFDKMRLGELKRLARCTSQAGDESSSFYTSFEVLAAHVWRSWARALEFPPNQVLKLLFSINVRNRVKPGLPEGYYGNAFVLGCAVTKDGELEEKGIGYGSGLVRRAKGRVGKEYVREVSELVSESMANPDLVGVLIVSQWSRLGMEMVDFGMGKPVHVGSVCCDRYCLFLPASDEDDESVKVMMAVPTFAVDSYHFLMQDSNLL
ncbi:hypothetical protein PIB30_012378 [Stylosanthes scabra]|uniref:Uncharacterized protein n=1 Tax=Stylosanthes scabra TaxID=79078 RepID=A0ABU6Q671_9FABA|nr:hypothetical protein [Stylosanthes scabra]